MEYLMENIKWIFSGIGVFIIGLVINIIIKKFKNNNSQKQNVKDNSTGIQVGGNFTINEKESERKKK